MVDLIFIKYLRVSYTVPDDKRRISPSKLGATKKLKIKINLYFALRLAFPTTFIIPRPSTREPNFLQTILGKLPFP